MKNRYVTKINDVELVNKILLMSLENSYIGFIENSFKNITKLKRQYKVKQYYIDLYFIEYKLAIECDEDHHYNKGNILLDKIRQKEIEDKLGCTFIRFNTKTELYEVLNMINSYIINHYKTNYTVF